MQHEQRPTAALGRFLKGQHELLADTQSTHARVNDELLHFGPVGRVGPRRRHELPAADQVAMRVDRHQQAGATFNFGTQRQPVAAGCIVSEPRQEAERGS